jgi:hypothetical protein
MKKSLIIAAAFTGLVISSSAAQAKTARCEIKIDGEGNYNGPCNFSPMENGSFEISAVDKRRNLIGRLESVAVFVGASANLDKNKAFYQYYVRNDKGHMGAELTRSTAKPACWVGNYDRICVY